MNNPLLYKIFHGFIVLFKVLTWKLLATYIVEYVSVLFERSLSNVYLYMYAALNRNLKRLFLSRSILLALGSIHKMFQTVT